MENIRMDLRLFDANTQVTTQQSLTEEMKTFYSDYLIDAAEPELVHDQFAQKHPIPANGGKTIQFRRFAPLGKALTALTEGVTPDGQSLSMTTVEAAVRQYGGYIQMSDLLLLTAIDNNLTMATKLLGAQAEVRLYQPVDGSKVHIGTLEQYDNGDVTVSDGKTRRVFQKSAIAQVRLHLTI